MKYDFVAPLIKLQACNFIKKRLLTQVFSCEICEIFKNTYFEEYLRTTASVIFFYGSQYHTFFSVQAQIEMVDKCWSKSLHSHLYFTQNNHLVLTILKAYFIIYVIDLSTKNKNVMTGVHIFTKIKNTDRWKFFWVNSFQKILIFHIFGFSENAQ